MMMVVVFMALVMRLCGRGVIGPGRGVAGRGQAADCRNHQGTKDAMRKVASRVVKTLSGGFQGRLKIH